MSKAAKLQFSEKLKSAMDAKGLHASELARRASLPRDHISRYLRAESLPQPQALSAIEEALDVDLGPLPPRYGRRESAANEVQMVIDSANRAHLTFDKTVSIEAARRILEILAAEAGS